MDGCKVKKKKKKSSPDNECAQNRLRARSRQKSISRLSYFCSEHYLGSVGPVPVFSSVSSGRHWTAAVIQTHLFPLSHPLLTPVLLSLTPPLPPTSHASFDSSPPTPSLPTHVSLLRTQGYLFFHRVEAPVGAR